MNYIINSHIQEGQPDDILRCLDTIHERSRWQTSDDS